MLDHLKLENVLFIDIETVPQHETYQMLPQQIKLLWDHKASFIIKDSSTSESIYNRAGIYAEFGKIICISIGILNKDKENVWKFRVKSFSGVDEKKILNDFIELLNKHYNKPKHLLCAHNGKEFDFPFIARRILINGLKLPKSLAIAGKKPWEIPHLDTLELWKFGDYKHYTSLNLLAAIFNIQTPKDDINGKDVSAVFYKEKDIKRIASYCEKDVLTVAQLLLRYKGENIIEQQDVTIVG